MVHSVLQGVPQSTSIQFRRFLQSHVDTDADIDMDMNIPTCKNICIYTCVYTYVYVYVDIYTDRPEIDSGRQIHHHQRTEAGSLRDPTAPGAQQQADAGSEVDAAPGRRSWVAVRELN